MEDLWIVWWKLSKPHKDLQRNTKSNQLRHLHKHNRYHRAANLLRLASRDSHGVIPPSKHFFIIFLPDCGYREPDIQQHLSNGTDKRLKSQILLLVILWTLRLTDSRPGCRTCLFETISSTSGSIPAWGSTGCRKVRDAGAEKETPVHCRVDPFEGSARPACSHDCCPALICKQNI